MHLRGVSIPSLDPEAMYDVTVGDGVFTRLDAVGDRDPEADVSELWPGYVEAHAHLGLPTNFNDTLDDPRVVALQYLFHGVTRVVDLFGFPLVQELWELGKAESTVPYPELVHCGYAATSIRNKEGLAGHGVEFPAPVHMLGVHGDIDSILASNRTRGASFLKVMFTDGTEQPGSPRRFSRLPEDILRELWRATSQQGIPCVLDCNTRDEVLQAHGFGFRLFAHPVRDVVLSAGDWQALAGARFGSTLSGLRPMTMRGEEFLREYGRDSFAATQDLENLEIAGRIDASFGERLDCQEQRLAALEVMRTNSLSALRRDALLVGTDSGNLGAFHGYSLLSELDLLLGDDPDPDLGTALRAAATYAGARFFDDLAGRPAGDGLLGVGAPATFNLLTSARGGALSDLPRLTVVHGVQVDREAVVQEIRALRAAPSRGKVSC
jgi:hypothetical protein